MGALQLSEKVRNCPIAGFRLNWIGLDKRFSDFGVSASSSRSVTTFNGYGAIVRVKPLPMPSTFKAAGTTFVGSVIVFLSVDFVEASTIHSACGSTVVTPSSVI